MTFSRTLIVTAVLVIFAGCGGGDPQNNTSTSSSTGAPSTGASLLLAGGGTGTSGSGGGGGALYIETYGSVKVLKSGTVDASFPDPAFTPDFGDHPFTVSSDTAVLLDQDLSNGNLYAITDDPNLYLGNGDGDTSDDPAVTGLTVEAGATLKLVEPYGDGYGVLQLTNDLVIYGTVTTDLTQTSNLYIEANVIDVESGGKITVSATSDSPSPDAGEIDLGYGYGLTSEIINRGTIEAKGLGSGSGGNGGLLHFEPDDLVFNYGTIDASGGSSDTGDGGSGGELDVYVDYGNFYSSGTVLMNGGNGDSGGDSENNDVGNINGYAVRVETAYVDNTRGKNGDIIISGTWAANGGNGTNGDGGLGGYIYLQTDALGAVTINAAMSTRGGNGTSGNGGYSYGIDIYSYLDPNASGGFTDPDSPGTISVAGQYDLSGGDGDQDGDGGGYFEVYGYGQNASNIGSDVNLMGFPVINLNGGDGFTNGGSAYDQAFEIYTDSPGGYPAGPITNEAEIDARGGNATGGAGSTGGNGGYVELATDSSNADSTTRVTNSGNIDVSGGTGDTGGDGGNITLDSRPQQTSYSGTLTVDGGIITIDGVVQP
jgi:hypothetical protein